MIYFRELTEMHQEMCHRFMEECKNNPDSQVRSSILNDIKEFERMVKDYMGAKMENYRFVKLDKSDVRTVSDLETGDFLVLNDENGYRESILKNGGTYYSEKKGTVVGITRELGEIERMKVYLIADDGTEFFVYEHDLQYWKKMIL